MQQQLDWRCEQHRSRWDCPDALVCKTKNGFGLIIHDGGSSFVSIEYCPWCGKSL